MRKDFAAAPGLLEVILSGDGEEFLKMFKDANAFNVLVGYGENIKPSALLEFERERKWDGKIVLRNKYVAQHAGMLEYIINNAKEVFVGFRKVLNESPVLALYYPNEISGHIFALIKFEGEVSCSRVLPYSSFRKVRDKVLSSGSYLSEDDIYKLKGYLSLSRSSKNSNIYKAKAVIKT